MELHISLAGRGDLSQRIYRQIIEAIIDGRLRIGDRLPPSRLLAEQLSVARHTVTVAYERLTAEGFLEGRVGAGTFVAPEAVRGIEPRDAPERCGASAADLDGGVSMRRCRPMSRHSGSTSGWVSPMGRCSRATSGAGSTPGSRWRPTPGDTATRRASRGCGPRWPGMPPWLARSGPGLTRSSSPMAPSRRSI